MEFLGARSMTSQRAVPDFLVGPAATTVAVLILAVAIYVSLRFSILQANRDFPQAEPKLKKLSRQQRRQQKIASSPKAMAADLEAGLIAPAEEKRRKPRAKRTRMQKLLEFFIADDEASAANPDDACGPFELDDHSWLVPEDDAATEPKTHARHYTIGDSSPEGAASPGPGIASASGVPGSADAFCLPDAAWRVPAAEPTVAVAQVDSAR